MKGTTYCFGKRFRGAIDPGDEPALLSLIYPGHTSSAEVLHKLRKRHPTGGVHVQMLFICNILLVYSVCEDTFRAESTSRMSMMIRAMA